MTKAAGLEIQQMNLRTFGNVYGITETSVRRMVHSKDFPAYKIGGKWYVDIPKFLKWRELEHVQSYKYA